MTWDCYTIRYPTFHFKEVAETCIIGYKCYKSILYVSLFELVPSKSKTSCNGASLDGILISLEFDPH